MNSKMKKLKVLCICAKGKNRSRYLAKYLKGKGYTTRFGGIDGGGDFVEKIEKEITVEDVNWADIVVIVRKRLVDIFNKKFGKVGKKIIALDVTDSRRLIPEEFAHLKDLDHTEFQKKWTYPQLRKAIKPYLPLK